MAKGKSLAGMMKAESKMDKKSGDKKGKVSPGEKKLEKAITKRGGKK